MVDILVNIELVKLELDDFFSPSGVAHCCVLQQRDVNPLLSGHNAVAHSEGGESLSFPSQPRRSLWTWGGVLLTSAGSHCDKDPCVFVRADLMVHADNDGNLSHRDLECGRQYICWAGTLSKTRCNTIFDTYLTLRSFSFNILWAIGLLYTLHS